MRFLSLLMILLFYFFSHSFLSCSLWFCCLQKRSDYSVNQFMLTSRGLPPQSKQPYPLCSFPGIHSDSEKWETDIYLVVWGTFLLAEWSSIHVNKWGFFIQFGFNWLPVVFSTAVSISTGNLDDLVEVSCASSKSCISKFQMLTGVLQSFTCIFRY